MIENKKKPNEQWFEVSVAQKYLKNQTKGQM
jgi:hypothetical protein